MKVIARYAFPQSSAARQRGAALFIALIVLVAMTLAAVALIRSVDTSTVIAGNLAFKQSSTSSADVALNNASDWIFASTASALQSDSPANGYYATSTGLDLMADATWTAGVSALASGTGITSGVDTSGNEIRYVVQRMCQGTGAATTGNCLFGAASTQSSSQAVKDATQAGGVTTLTASPLYRITARVSGPRNTVSFVQGFLY
jgi:type IV pilus assembly protein PilX